jgi:hypothetical protein
MFYFKKKLQPKHTSFAEICKKLKEVRRACLKSNANAMSKLYDSANLKKCSHLSLAVAGKVDFAVMPDLQTIRTPQC